MGDRSSEALSAEQVWADPRPPLPRAEVVAMARRLHDADLDPAHTIEWHDLSPAWRERYLVLAAAALAEATEQEEDPT